MPDTRNRITFTVDPDDYRSLERIARANGLAVSWLLRHLIRDFVSNHDETSNLVLQKNDE